MSAMPEPTTPELEVVVVFKPDGTIQSGGHPSISLEHHAEELLKIGASKICAQGNVPGPFFVTPRSGAATGRVNAYAIPREDWIRISRGIVGSFGFRMWTGAPFPDLVLEEGCTLNRQVLPSGMQGAAAAMPVLIRELVGRPCRCYRPGDLLSDDFVPDRANIEHDEEGRISDIWFG